MTVSSTELVTVERPLTLERPSPAVIITNEQTDLIKKTIAKDATDAELALFVYDCKRRGVHPLDKLIHFTKRAGKYTPVTSIDMFRSRAAGSREHMGTDDAVFVGAPGDHDFAASVTVYRLVQGEKCAFTATARMSEYMPDPPNDFMWKKMPHGQLSKCAEALALRKGFPQELEGLHTFDEMNQAGVMEHEPQPPAEVKQPQRRSATGAAPAAKAAPPGALIATGVIGKLYDDKKPYAVLLQGSQVKYTTFDDAVLADLKAFAGTVHVVHLAYTETVKGDRTYANVVGVSIADTPKPATAPAAPPADPRSYSPFDKPGREPGEDD